MSRLRVMRLGFLLLLLICFLVWASRSIYLSNSTMSLGKDQIVIDLDHREVSNSPNLQFDGTLALSRFL